MQLTLKKPRVFLALETSGTIILTDRILDIACLKLVPDGTPAAKSRCLGIEA